MALRTTRITEAPIPTDTMVARPPTPTITARLTPLATTLRAPTTRLRITRATTTLHRILMARQPLRTTMLRPPITGELLQPASTTAATLRLEFTAVITDPALFIGRDWRQFERPLHEAIDSERQSIPKRMEPNREGGE